MRKPNQYENAIKLGRTIDFLLGKREFLYEEDTFSRELHDPTVTFIDIKDYGEKHGETKMSKQLKTDIKKTLELDLSPFELFYITYYISEYIKSYYHEQKLTVEWIADEEIKNLIKKHYNFFLAQFDSSEKFNYEFPKQSNGFFIRNIRAKYSQIKENYGVDLLA